MDFSHAEGDKIDLSAIDADKSTSGTNDAFTMLVIGSAAFTAVHQLRFDPATHLLSGNVNANLAADFEIYLPSVSSLVGAPGGDIIL